MNILLINISLRPESKRKIFPIGLGHVATSMQLSGFEFDLVDMDAYKMSLDEFENNIKNRHYDIICLGCLVSGYSKLKNILKIVKKYNPISTIIVGNSVATSIIDTLFTNTPVDIAVMGEGDITIVDMIS